MIDCDLIIQIGQLYGDAWLGALGAPPYPRGLPSISPLET
jgi:hypothetical protein